MSHTSDPADPRLTRGVDSEPTAQAPAYLVLSDEERGKGFVRPDTRRRVDPHACTPAAHVDNSHAARTARRAGFLRDVLPAPK